MVVRHVIFFFFDSNPPRSIVRQQSPSVVPSGANRRGVKSPALREPLPVFYVPRYKTAGVRNVRLMAYAYYIHRVTVI